MKMIAASVLATFISASALAGEVIPAPVQQGQELPKQAPVQQAPVQQGGVVVQGKEMPKHAPVQQAPVQQGSVVQGKELPKQAPVQQGEVIQGKELPKQAPVQQGEVIQGQELPKQAPVQQGEVIQGQELPKQAPVQQGEMGKQEGGKQVTYRRTTLEWNSSEESINARLYHTMSNYGRYLNTFNPTERPNVYLDGSRVYMIDGGEGSLMCDRSLAGSVWGYSCDMNYPHEAYWTNDRFSIPALLATALRYDWENGHSFGGRRSIYGTYEGYPGYAIYDANPGIGIMCYSNRFGGLSLNSFRCGFNIGL